MKKILLIPFILLCMILFAVPACAMKNEPDNFRGIPWGAETSRNNLKKWGLIQVGLVENGTISLYWRSPDEEYMGGAKISSYITYRFHNKLGFAQAVIFFDGKENLDLIYKACIANWGTPDYEGRKKEGGSDWINCSWEGERTTVLLVCSYGLSEDISDLGVMYITQKKYSEHRKKAEALQKQKERGF